MTITTAQKLLKDIKTFRKDLESSQIKLPPNLLGIYGELLVYSELFNRFADKGYEVVYNLGTRRADIILKKDKKEIYIEVKTSRLKNEDKRSNYGFAINVKPCTKHKDKYYNHSSRGAVKGDFCYFDYLVAVCLSEDLSKFDFYVFPRSFFEDHEEVLRNKSTRFKTATHRLIFVKEEYKKETKEITDFDRFLTENLDKVYKDRWENLIVRNSPM